MSEANNITEKVRQGLNSFTTETYNTVAKVIQSIADRLNRQNRRDLKKITVEQKNNKTVEIDKELTIESKEQENLVLFQAKGNLDNGELEISINRISEQQSKAIQQLIESKRGQTISEAKNLLVKINGEIVIETDAKGEVIKNDLTSANNLVRAINKSSLSSETPNRVKENESRVKAERIANFFKIKPKNFRQGQPRQIPEQKKEESRELAASWLELNPDSKNPYYEVVDGTILLSDDFIKKQNGLNNINNLTDKIKEIKNSESERIQSLKSNLDSNQIYTAKDKKAVSKIKSIFKDENDRPSQQMLKVQQERINEVLKNKSLSDKVSILSDVEIKSAPAVSLLRDLYIVKLEKSNSLNLVNEAVNSFDKKQEMTL